MQRTQIAPGAAYTEIAADRFKRCLISINFILPASRQDATAFALLPMVMERGWSGCPDPTRLSRQLAQLYGAGMSVFSGMLGADRLITVQVNGLKNDYAVQGEDLLDAYLRLAFGVAFAPDVQNGGFDAAAVRVEKDKLHERQLGEINNKRRRCMLQARRLFFGDAPAGLEPNGYPEDLPALTPQVLYEAWRRMVCTARIEVLALGADTARVEKHLAAALAETAALARPGEVRAVDLTSAPPMPVRPTVYTGEPVAAQQGKLCMMYTVKEPFAPQQMEAVRVALALFGGSPTSRLFVNVREKQSLCYFCAAGYWRHTGVMAVESGVAFEDADRAVQAIQNELETLCTQPVGEAELAEARLYLNSALQGMEDNLSGLEYWTLGEIVTGAMRTPAIAAQQLAAVSAQDVTTVLQNFSLSVVYTLRKGGRTDG